MDKGETDLLEAFALPLPIIVIAELLGVPTHDRNRFRAWSNALIAPTPDAARNEQKILKSRQLMEDFINYLRAIFAARRAQPRDDLISSLLAAEEAGDVFSEDELFSMILLLIVVGHETSVNLIGNGTLALLQHPDAWLTCYPFLALQFFGQGLGDRLRNRVAALEKNDGAGSSHGLENLSRHLLHALARHLHHHRSGDQ